MIDTVIEKFNLLKLKTCAHNLSQCIELANGLLGVRFHPGTSHRADKLIR